MITLSHDDHHNTLLYHLMSHDLCDLLHDTLPQVKESPVPSDTLLTVDLKSGSKIKIGTHTITLDKFFEGNLKAMKWLDIGNG